MEIEASVNFHNRFEVEVRDKDTGKLKQKGIAENIVLDRAYSRLCILGSYFTKIHFGKGTGYLSPTRTTLFSPLGYKSAVDEEKIKSFPISSVTKKITLNPEEYVGETITEVGISESTSFINTHALIKDAEGNPLSITKTGIDVIIIYATVFIKLSNPSQKFKFINPASGMNRLVNNLLDGASVTNQIEVGSSNFELYPEWGIALQLKILETDPNISTDITNKKRILTTRLDINSGNGVEGIQEIGLAGICRVSLPEPSIFSSFSKKDVIIGTGDGIETIFNFPNIEPQNLIIKIDGSTTTQYSNQTTKENYSILPLLSLVDLSDELTNIGKMENYNTFYYSGTQGIPEESVFKVKTNNLNGKQIWFRLYSNNTNVYVDFNIFGSSDGIEWSSLYNASGNLSRRDVDRYYTFIENYDYLKLILRNNGSPGRLRIGVLDQDYINACRIEFDTPPPEGSIITADYDVEYIPKTSDYVLDVVFEIQFEGV